MKSKWLIRILKLVALLMVVAAGLSILSVVLIRRTPDWYQPDQSTAEQRRGAADRLENMLITLRNWGGKRHAARVVVKPSVDAQAQQRVQQILSEKADEAFTIRFTDDELNAFFNKWADSKDRRAWFEQYVEDPRLVIRDNQLIVVGQAKTLGLIVSLVFQPRLDETGQLNLHLEHVLGGTLPLPNAMWSGQRESVERTLQRRLPDYQAGAAITPDGIANGDASSAAMNQLLLATLRDEPASAVIFVPIELAHLSQSLPIKITALTVHDHTLEMTAQEMSEDERKAFLERLKAN